MPLNKKLIIGFMTIMLCSCNLNLTSGNSSSNTTNSSSPNLSQSTTISNSSSSENKSTNSEKPISNVIIIHNLDKEYTFRIHNNYFKYSDIPDYTFEDREIIGWYFDELFVEPIEVNTTYYVEGNLDIYAKVVFNANYYIKDFLIDSVSKVYINTENNKVVNTKDEYTNATFEIVDEKVTDNNFPITNMKMKCRGNSSYGNAHLSGDSFENSKFSYKIKFDKKQDLFGFGKDKTWNLVANFMDRSFIRNHLTYSLASLMSGLEFSVEHQYVELYINNEYQGLYLLTESVKTGSNRVDIEEDYNADTVEIPFLLEQDQKVLEDGSINNVDYFWSNNIPFSTKYPDDFTTSNITQAQFNYIKDCVDDLYNSVTKDNYNQVLDVNSFIDYFMVQEIFRNVDVNHSSVYFYKRPNEVFKMGPIWDFDLSMGNYDYIDSSPIGFLKSYVGGGGNHFYNSLMAHSEFKNAYIARFNFVKDTYLEAMKLALPEIIKTLKPYAEKDYGKWKTLNNYVDCLANNPDLVAINSFEGQVNYIEDYLFNGIYSNGRNYQGRISWLSENLKNY